MSEASRVANKGRLVSSASTATLVYELSPDYVRSAHGNFPLSTTQDHEDDPANFVILSKPGLGKLMGSMHPAGALYEKPINLRLVLEQHNNFRKVLEDYGSCRIYSCSVLTDDVQASACLISARSF